MTASTRASVTATPVDEPCQASAAWTVDALRSVWVHQQDRVSDRIDVIERAVAALVNGSLDTALREDAERAAHMLAGSIGMFGFIDASEAAHRLELELAHPKPDRAPALSALLQRLRRGVQEPVVLCLAASDSGVNIRI
jgi:HPt (histidine-containing phosphotransfer) domain-containing protein